MCRLWCVFLFGFCFVFVQELNETLVVVVVAVVKFVIIFAVVVCYFFLAELRITSYVSPTTPLKILSFTQTHTLKTHLTLFLVFFSFFFVNAVIFSNWSM